MFESVDNFTPDAFTPTKWDSAADKANFAKTFISFVESDFDWSKFNKRFYEKLTNTFGHIAHYNQHGFYEEFFRDFEGKIRFLKMSLDWSMGGDPHWTYSDVERALQAWLRHSKILERYEKKEADAVECIERRLLAKLKAKYEGSPS